MVMINFLPPLMLFFLFKDCMFMSSFFFLDKNSYSLIFIFPLIFSLIGFCSFPLTSFYNSKFYSIIFFFLMVFLFFCFSSSISFFFLFFLESCVFLMILLIFNFSKDSDKFSSVVFMFIMNCLGSIPFMYFCSVCGSSFLNPDLEETSFFSLWVLFSCYFLLVSKVPMFFFHFWLSKAHVSASGSGSMILASLMLKIGTLGIFKFCFLFLFSSTIFLFSFFCSLGVFSCLILSLVMIRFFDLKYMVACSSIVHMSLIFPSSFFPNSMSLLSSFMMMVGHGLISCFIFFLVSLIYELSLNRSSDSGKSIESVSSVLIFLLYLFFLFNLGFPPLVSFLSEFGFISLFLKVSFLFLSSFCFSLMLVGLLFMMIILLFLFGKYTKKWTGYLDKLVMSCFSQFLFYFIPVMLIFN